MMLMDRGVEVDHITIFRWIQAYAGELEKRIRRAFRLGTGFPTPPWPAAHTQPAA
jgi:hypothetical protein